MKKIYLLAIALMGCYGMNAQGFAGAISGGYLTELDGIGGSADLIYEIDEKFGIAGTFTFAAADDSGARAKWTALDLNARYNVIGGLYGFAGGEYLSVNIKELGLGGGNPLSAGPAVTDSEFGINVGAGYIYNLVDNVNIFADVKYVILDAGYVHSRLGLLFDF